MKYVMSLIFSLLVTVPAFALDLPTGVTLPKISKYDSPKSSDDGVVVLTAAAEDGEILLAYDGDPYYFYPDFDSVGVQWAVRFTPPQTCELSYFEVTTYNETWTPGEVAVSLYQGDETTGPGTPIFSDISFEASADGSRQQITLDPPVDVGDGDFFIAIKTLSAASPHVTSDGDGNGTGRTWYRGPTQGWDWVEDVDMNIRAYVIPYGNDVVAPTIIHYGDHAAYSGDGQMLITAQVEDASGLQKVRLHYSTNIGVSYYDIPMSLNSGLYRATIPVQAPGSTVQYYIEAVDNSDNHNIMLEPASGALSPHEFTTFAGRQLKYDDGWPAFFFIESDVFDDNKFAVLFTPTSYPITLKELRVFVSDTSPFRISVYTAPTGEPGAVMAGPYTINSAESPGWAEVTIPDIDQPVITAGHFFVVFEWLSTSPEYPGVGTDTLSADGRSMWYDNGFGWSTYAGGDWIMRAVYSTSTGVLEEETGSVPQRFSLAQNYPNPFNPGTTIEYALVQPNSVSLAIYNVKGQKIRREDFGVQTVGTHLYWWDGRDDQGQRVASGIYYYRLQAGEYSKSHKMVLMK